MSGPGTVQWRNRIMGGLLAAGVVALVVWAVFHELTPSGSYTDLRLGAIVAALVLIVLATGVWIFSLRASPLEDQQTRLLFDLPVGGLMLVDPTLRVRFANPTVGEIFGRPVSEIVGSSGVELFVPEARENVRTQVAQQQPNSPPVSLELRGLRPDGTTVPLELVLRAVARRGRTLVGIHLRDLVEREALVEALAGRAAELARSNRELEQFTYIASHDLQEPLRMVGSYTQLLSNRYADRLDTDAKEFLGYAQEGATRMRELIDDLLDYSRLGTRAQPLRETSVEEVLDRALQNLRGSIEEAKAEVTHGPMPRVFGDPTQLAQVFQNLIGNAIKFRGPGAPHVRVEAVRKGPDWLFSVKDDGIGIAPEYQNRIFVIFQRLHSREEYPGTGIGLAVTQKVVERHGGRIWVESTGEPGKGTTFWFTIPAEKRAPPIAPAPALTAEQKAVNVRAHDLIEDRLRELA